MLSWATAWTHGAAPATQARAINVRRVLETVSLVMSAPVHIEDGCALDVRWVGKWTYAGCMRGITDSNAYWGKRVWSATGIGRRNRVREGAARGSGVRRVGGDVRVVDFER